MQAGGVRGPDDAISHYEMADGVIRFGSEERPGASPMFVRDLRHALHYHYDIPKPEGGWKPIESFTTAEKAKLRPIAETLAMLDGNAFFTLGGRAEREWYESYLPEAHALYESNGGDEGWAGEASFAKKAA